MNHSAYPLYCPNVEAREQKKDRSRRLAVGWNLSVYLYRG